LCQKALLQSPPRGKLEAAARAETQTTQMSKPSKSQWIFGELFFRRGNTEGFVRLGTDDASLRAAGKTVGTVWVGGKITNLRSQSSGHVYFTLKDANAQLNCVSVQPRKNSAARTARRWKKSFCCKAT